MSGAALAAVWQLPGRICAQVLGLPFAQYRPQWPGAAIVPDNLLRTLPVWITADDKLMASKPLKFGNPVAYAAADPALTQAGDYLVGSIVLGDPVETFYIANQDIPAVITVVRCNQTISIERPLVSSAAGLESGYGGDTTPLVPGTPDQPAVLTAWPASVLVTLRAVRGPVELPGDTGDGRWIVLLPAIPGVEFRVSDIIVLGDADATRAVVNAAELTAMGWRLAAEEEST